MFSDVSMWVSREQAGGRKESNAGLMLRIIWLIPAEPLTKGGEPWAN